MPSTPAAYTFPTGAFAEKALVSVPMWYVRRCIGDTTNDGWRWGSLSPEEQELFKAEPGRREALAVEFWEGEKDRLADNEKRRSKAKTGKKED